MTQKSFKMHPTRRIYPAALAARAIAVLSALLAALLLMTALAPPTYALDRRGGDVTIVAAGQVVDDDLFASGRLVQIDGTVRGDVYAFAQSVTVAGIVEGDVIAVAQEVVIDGEVRGNVRAAGATVQVNGSVGRNVTGAAQSLRLGSGGRIGGNWVGAGETISLAGDIGGSLAGASESVLLQGRVGRGAELALGALTVGPNASIGGNLDYHAEDQVQVSPSVVRGQVRFHQSDRTERVRRTDGNRFFNAAGTFFSLTWLAGSAVVGLVLLRAFPRFVARFLDALERGPVTNFVVGVVAIVATLPLAILLGITIVGLPAAALLGGGYVAGLFGGWLLLAIALGGIMIGFVRKGVAPSLSWAFLLGLLTLYIGTRIPFLGPLVSFVGLSLGFGTLLTALYRTWRKAEITAQTSPSGPPTMDFSDA